MENPMSGILYCQCSFQNKKYICSGHIVGLYMYVVYFYKSKNKIRESAKKMDSKPE